MYNINYLVKGITINELVIRFINTVFISLLLLF